MKALTVKQPWASLIVSGVKDLENRDWPTHYRGLIAIHSSRRLAREDLEEAGELIHSFVPGFRADLFRQCRFPTGMILGTVKLVDCVAACESPWFQGTYGFVLKNAVAFPCPVVCRGELGFWEVPAYLLPRLREEYRVARSQPYSSACLS
jgi:hypothetical protein